MHLQSYSKLQAGLTSEKVNN